MSRSEALEICTRLDGLRVRLARAMVAFERDREYERDGCPNSVAWLKLHGRLSTAMAMEVMAVARQLSRLPEVERAVSAGEIGFQHAAVIAESADKVGAESLLSREVELVEKAGRSDPASFRQEVRKVEQQVDAELVRREADRVYQSRRLDVVTKGDGRVWVDGVLDPEGGAVLKKALEAAMGPRSNQETRSDRQRRADGLVDIAQRALDGRRFGETGCQRPHLNVLVEADGAGSIEGLGPVPRETIERLLCDCSVSVNGSPEVRTFSPAKRRGIAGRSRACQFPGCDRPVDWTEGHHLEWWVEGGRTVAANGALLCRFHHRLVHEGGWRLAREGDRLVAVRPGARARAPASGTSAGPPSARAPAAPG